MKKELKVGTARINTYPIYGMISSLVSNNPENNDWIYNNFIQLRYLMGEHILMYEQYRSLLFSCPYIMTEAFSRNTIERLYSSYKDFIRESIINDGYVFPYCDRYYLSEYDKYKEHDIHELFVIGFDDEAEEFICFDNKMDGKYARFSVPYEELEAALVNKKRDNYFDNTYVLRREDWWYKDTINEKQVYVLFEEYSESVYRRNQAEYFSAIKYGFSAHYDVLSDLKKIAQEGNPDRRAICLLEEHKGLMSERFRRLYEQFHRDVYLELYEGYLDIYKEYQRLKYAFLKNIYVENQEDWANICNYLENLITKEKKLIDNTLPKMQV